MYSGDEYYGDDVTGPLVRSRVVHMPLSIRLSELENGRYGHSWTQHEEKREIYFPSGETYVWDYQRAVYVKV